jgi:hypothetical protein
MDFGRWHDIKWPYKVMCTHCDYTVRVHTERQYREAIDSHNLDTCREHWKFNVSRSKDIPPPPPARVIHPITINYLDVEPEEIMK